MYLNKDLIELLNKAIKIEGGDTILDDSFIPELSKIVPIKDLLAAVEKSRSQIDWAKVRDIINNDKGLEVLDPDDEILMKDVDVHIERMDDGHIWIGFYYRSKPTRSCIHLHTDFTGEFDEEGFEKSHPIKINFLEED